MESSSPRRLFVWFRRLLAMGFIIVYLGAGVFFLYAHLIGDTGRFGVGYFWTWDMFPNYPSFSARRSALGQTKSGQYLRVFPTSKVRYHRGGHGDLTRFDLPRNDDSLRQAVSETLHAYPPDKMADPVTYVFLVEKDWPVRFNLPNNLYRSAFGEDNPHRHSWRIVDEGSVAGNGEIRWTSSQ